MRNRSRVTRRAFIASGSAAATTLIVGGHNPASLENAAAQDPIDIQIDPALLEPATEPAEWEVEKDYDTTPADPIDPTEYCDLKLFPDVPASVTALSGLLMASDLNQVPNATLVQQFVYSSGSEAAADFAHVRAETRALAAEKYYLASAEEFEIGDNSPEMSLDTHMAPNGTGYALLTLLHGATITTLRSGAMQADPPVETLREMARQIQATPGDATPIATPAGDTSANGVEQAQLAVAWQVQGWAWNYGPLDIHPDRYLSPVCLPPG